MTTADLVPTASHLVPFRDELPPRPSSPSPPGDEDENSVPQGPSRPRPTPIDNPTSHPMKGSPMTTPDEHTSEQAEEDGLTARTLYIDDDQDSNVPAEPGAREARYAEAIGVALATTWSLDEGAHEDLTRAATHAVLAVADAEQAELREDLAEYDGILGRQGDLLTRTANILRGDPPELTSWSHHDVPERAQEVVALVGKVRALAAEHDHCSGCPTPWWLRALLASSPAATTGEAGAVDNYGLPTAGHEPRARYCICIVGIPVEALRDDLRCPACDAQRAELGLGPAPVSSGEAGAGEAAPKYAPSHGFTPRVGNPFADPADCHVMLARYVCPYTKEQHDPSLPPVDIDVFGYRRRAPVVAPSDEGGEGR